MFEDDEAAYIRLLGLLLLGVELHDGSDGLLLPPGRLPSSLPLLPAALPALQEPHHRPAVVVPLQQMEAAVVVITEAVPVAHGAAGAVGADAVVIN